MPFPLQLHPRNRARISSPRCFPATGTLTRAIRPFRGPFHVSSPSEDPSSPDCCRPSGPCPLLYRNAALPSRMPRGTLDVSCPALPGRPGWRSTPETPLPPERWSAGDKVTSDHCLELMGWDGVEVGARPGWTLDSEGVDWSTLGRRGYGTGPSQTASGWRTGGLVAVVVLVRCRPRGNRHSKPYES